MKRRNFFASLFAAGAIVKHPVLTHSPESSGNPETVTPRELFAKFHLNGNDLQIAFDRQLVCTSKKIPAHVKLDPNYLKADLELDELIKKSDQETLERLARDIDKKILGY